MTIQLKRAYDAPTNDDGYRVLVERLWPRGVSKEDARLDDWVKEIAPSTELRKWFAHDGDRWKEFQERYRKELNDNEDAHAVIDGLKQRAMQGTLTLVFASRDTEHNSAVVLKALLEQK